MLFIKKIVIGRKSNASYFTEKESGEHRLRILQWQRERPFWHYVSSLYMLCL